MKTLKVVAIVVTYNGTRWVTKCFKSLTNSSISLHIIAVDNGSSDETVSQIRSLFPAVNIIESGVNLGFGKANNLGFKKALEENADYFFLLNQDAWVEKDTVEKLVRVASKNREYGIVSPFHLLPDGQKLEWYFSTYITPEKCKNLYSDIYFNQVKEIYEVDFVNAAAWLITKECLSIVGGFDPLFPHYGEDDDYCNRTIYKKIKVGVIPCSTIYHDITYQSWDQIKFNKQRQLVFSFIELKNLRYTYRFAVFSYAKNRIDKLVFLLFTGKWKELFFMFKVLLSSFSYIFKISKSRKLSKSEFAFLN